MTNEAIYLGVAQTLLALAIAGERLIHRIIGGKSHETRLKDLEEKAVTTHAKANDIQTKIGNIEIKLAEINEHLKNTDKNVDRLDR